MGASGAAARRNGVCVCVGGGGAGAVPALARPCRAQRLGAALRAAEEEAGQAAAARDGQQQRSGHGAKDPDPDLGCEGSTGGAPCQSTRDVGD